MGDNVGDGDGTRQETPHHSLPACPTLLCLLGVTLECNPLRLDGEPGGQMNEDTGTTWRTLPNTDNPASPSGYYDISHTS